ncbi:MAG: phosphate ABC transporter permease subunit PstC [Candidatus Omnitrophica bacterium]|nr:phosphate ABC transporter permease subunit PstC [Candidatus Omnitrophota bacterium]
MKRARKENLIKRLFCLFSLFSIVFLLGIVIVLFKEGLPIFKVTSFGKFFFGKFWYPTYEPPDFGILPLLLGSLWVTAGALIIAVPLGVASAVYISEVAHPKIKGLIKPAIELLAGVPSVVYGFFGMVVVAPLVQKFFGLPVGLNALTASILLGVMAIPTITSISEDAISSVPKSFKEASYALGANRWETTVKVTVPSAAGGISTAIILGMGRAIGETMTVLMVAGGAAVIPRSFFQPVRTMTATIAAEMGETVVGSEHFHALFAIALVLFVLTLSLNIGADVLTQKFRKRLR